MTVNRKQGRRYINPSHYSAQTTGVYIRTRAGMVRLPLFDPDYINPAVAVPPTSLPTLPTEALKRRLRYMREPGFGDPGTPEEKLMLRQELKRREER